MRKYKHVRVLAAILALTMLLTLIGCTSNQAPPTTASNDSPNTGKQEKIVWRLQSSWGPGLEIQRQVDDFAKMVYEMSDGRLEIQSTTAGTIVGGLEVFDAVDQGVLDAAHSGSFYWLSKEPAAPFFAAVPGGLTVLEYIMWLYAGDGSDLWQEMYKDYNFGFAGACGLNLTETFAWSNKKITSLDDFKGLKFRSVGYWGEIITKLGASVVTLPGGEIYGALEQGILDAAEFCNPESDIQSALHEVAQYAHFPGIHQPVSILELIINKDSWNKLTPDLQEIVKAAAKATTIEGLGQSIKKDAEAIKAFDEYGTELVKLPPELIAEVNEIAKELYKEKAAKDPFIKKVYDSQMETREAYKYWDSYMNLDLLRE